MQRMEQRHEGRPEQRQQLVQQQHHRLQATAIQVAAVIRFHIQDYLHNLVLGGDALSEKLSSEVAQQDCIRRLAWEALHRGGVRLIAKLAKREGTQDAIDEIDDTIVPIFRMPPQVLLSGGPHLTEKQLSPPTAKGDANIESDVHQGYDPLSPKYIAEAAWGFMSDNLAPDNLRDYIRVSTAQTTLMTVDDLPDIERGYEKWYMDAENVHRLAHREIDDPGKKVFIHGFRERLGGKKNSVYDLWKRGLTKKPKEGDPKFVGHIMRDAQGNFLGVSTETLFPRGANENCRKFAREYLSRGVTGGELQYDIDRRELRSELLEGSDCIVFYDTLFALVRHAAHCLFLKSMEYAVNDNPDNKHVVLYISRGFYAEEEHGGQRRKIKSMITVPNRPSLSFFYQKLLSDFAIDQNPERTTARREYGDRTYHLSGVWRQMHGYLKSVHRRCQESWQQTVRRFKYTLDEEDFFTIPDEMPTSDPNSEK